jgi:hypothetical protein
MAAWALQAGLWCSAQAAFSDSLADLGSGTFGVVEARTLATAVKRVRGLQPSPAALYCLRCFAACEDMQQFCSAGGCFLTALASHDTDSRSSLQHS